MARIRKIRPDGSQIWQRGCSYDGSESNFINWAYELSDYTIIAVGGTNNVWESDAGYLVKLDSAGNLEWERKYNKSIAPDLFYNVLPTTDGGFLLTGQCLNLVTNNQDAWLLKVDSLGCAYEDCTVGIEEESKKVMVDVYPNPTSGVLNLELQEDKQYDLILTDLQGKVVYASTTLSMTNTIDVSGFSNGLYLLTLENEEQRTTVKVVVQH